ncbi:hypothetical protein P4S72_00010 [Vibrio sp. PP-XX7]
MIGSLVYIKWRGQFFVDVTAQLTAPEIEEAKITDEYKKKVSFYNHDIYWDL